MEDVNISNICGAYSTFEINRDSQRDVSSLADQKPAHLQIKSCVGCQKR